MGIDANLTLEQRDILNQVRETVGDILTPVHDDEFLVRFLIARRYDVESSIQMIRKDESFIINGFFLGISQKLFTYVHLAFWKKNDFDDILANYTLEKKSNYFFTTPLGFDKEGSLVRLLKIGLTDLKGLVMSHTVTDSIRIAVYYLAQDLRAQKKRRELHGDGTDCKMSYILDLESLPWSCLISRPLITHFLILLRAYESNFPEYLKVAYIANAPSFFGLILNFVKSVLPSDILSKVIVLNSGNGIFRMRRRKLMKLIKVDISSRKHKIQTSAEILRSVMDESILPAYLGGTLKSPDEDPTCPHLFPIPPGTPVPEEFYLPSNLTSLDGDPEAKKTIVLNQSSFTIEIEVTKEDVVIIWDFETIEYDIGIGLRFKKRGETEFKDIIPIRRVNSHRFTESGRYDCKELGTYELVFDNTYSWWAKKELTYKIAIEAMDISSEKSV